MDKGKYLKFIGDTCSNFTNGKYYKVNDIGSIVKKGERHLAVIDAYNIPRAFSMSKKDESYFGNIGVLVNIKYNVEDLLSKLSEYLFLDSLPHDNSEAAIKQSIRYNRIIGYIKHRLREQT